MNSLEDREMLENVSTAFIKVLSSLQENFCLDEEVLKPSELGQINIFLPIFMNKANKHYMEAFNKELPLEYIIDDEAVCSCIPVLLSQDNNIFSNYIYFLHYTIEQYIKEYKNPLLLVDGSIPINKLFYEFEQDAVNKKIKLRKKALQDMANKANDTKK